MTDNTITTQPIPKYVTTNGTFHVNIISVNIGGYDHVYN